jgi:pimeloyl-ACP methyl ester carboxylesterase
MTDTQWLTIERDGVRLAVRDFGGEGPPALLLHGLAGEAAEWGETASWLRRHRRVLALEERGHGRSPRAPDDVSIQARVTDVAWVIESLELGGVLLIGQSLGGHLAIHVAARHPRLVEQLVVVEASPLGLGATGADRQAAAIAESLLESPRGVNVDPEAAARMLAAAIANDAWSEWSRIRCPVLVVRGAAGRLSAAEACRMESSGRSARLVEVPGAGHELHLERPADWEAALLGFLAGPPPARSERVSPGNHAEVEHLLDSLEGWSRRRPDVRALALVGSWARNEARPGSDLDLVLLSDDPTRYLERDGWAQELGAKRVTPPTVWGVLTERRLHMPSGLEVDVAIGSPSWANTDPLDPGTKRVASGGLVPLHDPDGLLARVNRAIDS